MGYFFFGVSESYLNLLLSGFSWHGSGRGKTDFASVLSGLPTWCPLTPEVTVPLGVLGPHSVSSDASPCRRAEAPHYCPYRFSPDTVGSGPNHPAAMRAPDPTPLSHYNLGRQSLGFPLSLSWQGWERSHRFVPVMFGCLRAIIVYKFSLLVGCSFPGFFLARDSRLLLRFLLLPLAFLWCELLYLQVWGFWGKKEERESSLPWVSRSLVGLQPSLCLSGTSVGFTCDAQNF